jgi:hypothetical protein
MIMNDEMEIIWKEMYVYYFKALFEDSDESHAELWQPISEPL